jgi:hypothetical protein
MSLWRARDPESGDVIEVEIPDPVVRWHDDGPILVIDVVPDAPWARSVHPHPLVTVDYSQPDGTWNETEFVSGITLVGPVARSVLNATDIAFPKGYVPREGNFSKADMIAFAHHISSEGAGADRGFSKGRIADELEKFEARKNNHDA